MVGIAAGRPVARAVARPVAGRGLGGVLPLANTMLDTFDAILSRTITAIASQSIGAPVVQGTGALHVLANGVQNVSITNPDIGINESPAAWGHMVACVDLGMSAEDNSVGNVRPTITTGGIAYAYQADTASGSAQPTIANFSGRGKRWLSFHPSNLRQTNWAGAQFPSAGAAVKSVAFQIQQSATGNFNSTPKVDAMCRPANTIPQICLTWDDVNDRQINDLQPLLSARGMVATMYAPHSVFGAGTKLTVANAFTLKAAGWAICVDSGLLDEPLNMATTVAGGVTQINAARDALISAGLSSAADGKHFCYSYGTAGYRSTSVAVAGVICNNTTTINLGGANAWSNSIAAGMTVKGTGLGTDPTVVSVPTQGTAVLSAAVPTATLTLTFCANQPGVLVTCNGTTTINCDTTGIVVGQRMTGYTVPANTTVTAIVTPGVSGQITVSNAVPATCARGSFYLSSGEWAAGKMEDALIAAGYLSGRDITQNGGFYSGYGIDPLYAIRLPGYSIDSTASSAAKCVADMQQAITDRKDLLAYGHFSAAHDQAHSVTVLDFLQARVSAGEVQVVTVPQWWATVSGRAPFA